MKKSFVHILILLFSLLATNAMASHIVGGEVTYKYLGVSDTNNRYEITLVIYEDCKNGQPDAIEMDNPAFLAAYTLDTNTRRYRLVGFDTSIFFSEEIGVPVNFSNACVTNIPSVCLLRKTFKRIFLLPIRSSSGYDVVYQRCCRNAATMNIQNPGDQGATYYCHIPPTSVVASNNSAKFTNYPPQIICRNNPLVYDNSATDPDGDSLSYEFCTADEGASPGNIKPFPAPPPFTPVSYISPPYSYDHPLTAYPILQINPVTGVITGTPNRLGRFLVTVCCHEWRQGVMINTVKREFQFVVTDCTKVVFACIPQLSTDVNTYIVQCDGFNVQFQNCSSGGTSYHWDFGVPGTNDDTSNLQEPTFTYPDTGIYVVKLVVNPSTNCRDSITRFVKVFPYFKSAFTDSGVYCPGKPIYFKDKSSASIKPITSWSWNFGDGEASNRQDTAHIYAAGGTYNVMLISQNIKNCVDTTVKQVVIENYKPFAGHDTTIVKGESVQFNAVGGYAYLWVPGTNLNDSTIYNPRGFYPDTGIFDYSVHVTSQFGCDGYDTIRVWVVNQAAFYMPSAFTPNGDGRNDIFRPIAIGYRSLKYFRVYNRFGEEVYYSTNISDGWDGTYKHMQAEMGVYFWQIAFVDRFGKDGFMKGDVTLVK